MKFVKQPNLPENAKTIVVSGEISREAEYGLYELDLNIIKTEPERILYKEVSYHPDMQMHHLGDSCAVCTSSMQKLLPSKMLTDVSDLPQGNYPGDVLYNAARVGNFLICSKKHTSEKIIDYCNTNGIEIINVKQGYAKCNVCIIDNKSIITSDSGIANACKKFPLDVLFVDDNKVKLGGFSHGFFGGASGKIRDDLLAVNGNIYLHDNSKEIIDFARKRNVEIVSLAKSVVTDIGSLVAVTEK